MGKGNVVLIGMPGAGKSTLGVVLAKVLGFDFVDCDILIQRAAGKTLQRIIDERGPEGFIELEDSVLSGLEARNTVIATGGSAVYSEGAMRHLAAIGTVVYLEVSIEQLRGRLGSLDERGVVMRKGSGAGLDGLYRQREPLYRRYAQITLNTDGMTLREAVLELADLLSAR